MELIPIYFVQILHELALSSCSCANCECPLYLLQILDFLLDFK